MRDVFALEPVVDLLTDVRGVVGHSLEGAGD
jgi:hypothetical protein